MPAAIWFEYLKETFGSKIDANQHRELLRACSDLIGVVNTHSFTVLQDLGLLHLSGDGSPIFTNEWARAGLYQYILFSSDGRPRRRFASEPPLPLTQQIGEALWHEDKRSCLNFASGAKGAAVLFAIKIMKDPQFITELDEGGCEKTLIFSVSSLLVSWRHPELADSLLSNYWDFISDEVVDAEEDVLAVASSVRSYGSAELAIKIFQSISGRESICGIRARHELAGVFRDRGKTDDRLKAEDLYESILLRNDLSEEQHVRTCCGAAENYYLSRKKELAINTLNSALDSVQHERFLSLIYHRMAAAYNHFGVRELDNAITWSEKAIRTFNGKFSGRFAARCLDTHARILFRFNEVAEAIQYLEKSLTLKNALGDRRGLQIGYLLLSQIQEKAGLMEMAWESAKQSLTLAERSRDSKGQFLSHRRLARLAGSNAALCETHEKLCMKFQEK